MERIYEQIRQYIDGQRLPMLLLWEELVNTESRSRQIEGVNQVCGILRREMEAAGAKTRTVPMENAGDMLIGEWNMESGKAPCCSSATWTPCSKRARPRRTPSGWTRRAWPTAPASWTWSRAWSWRCTW